MSLIIAAGTSVAEFVATNDYVTSLALDLSKRIYAGSLDQLALSINRFFRSFLEKALR
jgi:hypothetical protein